MTEKTREQLLEEQNQALKEVISTEAELGKLPEETKKENGTGVNPNIATPNLQVLRDLTMPKAQPGLFTVPRMRLF